MNSWAVEYLDRKPKGRYCAASFYKPDHSFEKVKAWVEANQKLKLVEEEKASNVFMKQYIGIRKMKWDMLWHAFYEIDGKETWDRVSKEEALRIAETL